MELDNNNHSVFLMYYHLILVIQYRRQVIDNTVSARLREIFEYIQPKYHITLQEWNGSVMLRRVLVIGAVMSVFIWGGLSTVANSVPVASSTTAWGITDPGF